MLGDALVLEHYPTHTSITMLGEDFNALIGYHWPNDSVTLSSLDENFIIARCRDEKRATQFSRGMVTSGNQFKCTSYCE
jgi:hypothetical protein